jgi:tryptophan-rich sensory protein
MAIAAWLVWCNGGFRGNRLALTLFLAQLALNSAWSFICFRLHNLPLSVADMALLWLTVLATTYAFLRVEPIAGQLFIVYLLWVTFAASLNFALWRLNA